MHSLLQITAKYCDNFGFNQFVDEDLQAYEKEYQQIRNVCSSKSLMQVEQFHNNEMYKNYRHERKLKNVNQLNTSALN